MKVDLTKGINIRIAGELGKFNSIPIDRLIKISEHLQSLVLNIAKNDIQDSQAIDLNNFKIELSGFKTGSAIPQFTFTQRLTPTVNNLELQRASVNNKFNELIEMASLGRYDKLKDIYPDSSRRNDMVNSVYGFVNSFGTAPVTFVNIDEKDLVSEIFKIKKFKTETKKNLLIEVINIAAEPEENYAVGKIKLTTSGNTTKKSIQEIYTKSNTTLSYSPDVIVHNGTSFILNFPLRCSLEKEDGYYIIQSEMLDLVGTGKTEDDAEANLAEEFSYIYKRYNEIDSSNLSTRILQIKDILNYLVNRVED